MEAKISQNSLLEASWGLLGRLGRVLGRLGASWRLPGDVLEASCGVLKPSWAVLAAKTSSAVAGCSFAVGLGGPQYQRRKHSRPLQTTLQITQTRSWAPSGPVRIQSAAKLRARHRA